MFSDEMQPQFRRARIVIGAIAHVALVVIGRYRISHPTLECVILTDESEGVLGDIEHSCDIIAELSRWIIRRGVVTKTLETNRRLVG